MNATTETRTASAYCCDHCDRLLIASIYDPSALCDYDSEREAFQALRAEVWA